MKPETTLSELEREPIVYFGCTWTEIKQSLWRGAAGALPATLIGMLWLPLPALPLLIPGVVGWLLLAYLQLRHIRRHRAGKPLYYERHRALLRRGAHPFIVQGKTYQVWRNHRSGRSLARRRPPLPDPKKV